MDAIHYHVRSEGRIEKRAVYIAIGINMAGIKGVLSMYVGENEKRQVLAFHNERSEKPRRRGYPDYLCRRPSRVYGNEETAFAHDFVLTKEDFLVPSVLMEERRTDPIGFQSVNKAV